MSEEQLIDELSQLVKEKDTLPKGYISEKIINGKKRYYLQWSENGKKKSKYVNESDVDKIRAKISERKRIEEKEKLLKQSLPAIAVKQNAFKSNILLGNNLRKYVSIVKEYKKRGIYKDVSDYLYGNIHDKVLILYGLRRTGKTTIIRQTILNMNEEDFSKTALVQIGNGITLADINKDMMNLMESGYKYVFIDEVTLIEDFIEGAALFSDIFASCGMKIVLSGTDSLGFFLSSDDQLYDRCIFVHTTFIPYKEFEEVLGIKGIDEYICYGGTMSLSGINYNERSTFSSKKNVDEYIDSAIAKNIQHSLKYYQYGGHFRSLYSLYEKNELTSAINRIVEDVNHRFTIEVLARDFTSHDLGISAKNFRNDKKSSNTILDRIDRDAFVAKLKKTLEIKNKEEQTITITDAHRFEIKEYLDALDLTAEIDIKSLPVEERTLTKTVFTQPGMRYAQAKQLIESLLDDKEFQTLSGEDRKNVTERILSEIKGRMMEDIVLLETKLSNPKKSVFQLQFAAGEFDMVVADSENLTCEIYEIKHSKEKSEEQYKNLIDDKKIKNTEFRYGKIVKKTVIYRGEDASLDNGIEYVNVEKYLKSLPF